jgi:predicted nucleic acid-binding protein
MILADTSIWINLLAGRVTIREEDLPNLVVCGPIAQEVLQGLKPGAVSDAFRDRFLALPVISDSTPLALFLSAAEIYRQGRRRGLTIRSSIDCLIAAIAIENSIRVWHHDRDFTAIARYTPLEIHAIPLV